MRGLEQEVGRGLALHLQQVFNINTIRIINIIPIIVIVIIYFSIIGNNPQPLASGLIKTQQFLHSYSYKSNCNIRLLARALVFLNLTSRASLLQTGLALTFV